MTKQTGRPPLPKHDRKSFRINLRLRQNEKEKLKTMSDKHQMTMTDFIRYKIGLLYD